MSADGKYTRVGEWLYERGYSSRIAIYGVSWSLALIGWCMMLWSYDFLQTFGYRDGGYRRFRSAHFLAGFDILTLLVRNTVEPTLEKVNLLTSSCSLLEFSFGF
jgi:hypothetical protein